ncbi:putative NADP-dependent oxidoreductase YfmJ [Spathaspora sp. JA1]|nr:putative NADP-dependent oxidoreductase YfmJ [Spathaspora sp. JA1]
MSIPSVATTIVIKNCPEKDTICEFDRPDSTFTIKQIPIPEHLPEGTCLVKTLLLSNDPHQRLSIQKNQEIGRSYAAPLVPGDIMTSLGIVEIVKSNSKKYEPGQIVIGLIRWADYAVLSDTADLHQPIKQPLEYPLEYYLSIFGITGLAAYFGLVDVGKVSKGSVVVVSAASGATGSMAVQIAKNILGAGKVIGISGSDSKCEFVMHELGADICFNYHDPNWETEFTQYIGTQFIDVFFDCVGGDILNFLLTKIKKGGRVAVCGSISGFNDKNSGKIGNWNEVITNTITLQGFLVFDYQDRFLEGATVLVEAVKAGKLKTDAAFHVKTCVGNDITEKIKQIPKIWKLLFTDYKPNGKLITRIV